MTERTYADILIIGAGLSGLMAANTLQAAGYKPLLLDKGRGVGGRLATRRIGPGVADHGAQFFTVREPEFKHMVDQWIDADLAFVWSLGWSDGSIADTPRDGHPRYAIRGGLNALAKHLANGLDVRTNVQISAVRYDQNQWHAETADGQAFSARTLLMTPPVPQSLRLLKDGSVELDPDTLTALLRIEYAPCLCGLFWIDGDVYLPEPGALQRPYAEIAWIADNERKGISTGGRIITLHASATYSRQHFEDTDAALISRFTAELVGFMNPSAHVRQAEIKRWRYSQPTVLHPERYLVDRKLPIVFAGDAFREPRVEGAALSGLAAARAVANLLSSDKG